MPALTPRNDVIRARNITASECGALLDKHPYTDPVKIWDRLNAPAHGTIEQTEPMLLGTFFEPYIAKYAAQKLGLRLRANPYTLEHKEVNLCATPDYYVLGHSMLLEVKLSSKLYVWTEDTLQPYIEWQARAQMAVTNRDAVIIAALVGSQFYTVTVTRDIEKEQRLLYEVDRFFQTYVLRDVRPAERDTTRIIARIEA